jgi:hypothetical protein
MGRFSGNLEDLNFSGGPAAFSEMPRDAGLVLSLVSPRGAALGLALGLEHEHRSALATY